MLRLPLYSLEKLIEWKRVEIAELFKQLVKALYSLEKLIEWKHSRSVPLGIFYPNSLLAREIN